MNYDITAIGEALIEFNQTNPGKPIYTQGFGGDTSNAVIAASRAGARCAYVSAVGSEHFGDLLRKLWHSERIDLEGIAVDTSAPTGLYFVTHTSHGHSFSYRRAGSAAARMTLSDSQKSIIVRSRYLHLSGISLAISDNAAAQCMQAVCLAREAGVHISLDSNLRLKLWPLDKARQVMLPMIAQADLFLPSLDDAMQLSGLREPDAIVDWSHALGAKQVVLKMGDQGVLLSDGQQRLPIASIQVQVQDATGAGDCFAGNLLARLVRGDTLAAAARYANTAAALSVQSFGAVAPLPYADAVQARLTQINSARSAR